MKYHRWIEALHYNGKLSPRKLMNLSHAAWVSDLKAQLADWLFAEKLRRWKLFLAFEWWAEIEVQLNLVKLKFLESVKKQEMELSILIWAWAGFMESCPSEVSMMSRLTNAIAEFLISQRIIDRINLETTCNQFSAKKTYYSLFPKNIKLWIPKTKNITLFFDSNMDFGVVKTNDPEPKVWFSVKQQISSRIHFL